MEQARRAIEEGRYAAFRDQHLDRAEAPADEVAGARSE
jgi:hypothetical protein